MPLIPFSAQSYERNAYGLPPQMLVNLFHETSPMPDRPSVLLPTPALTAFAEVGSGPIRLIFQEDGVLDGQAYIVSGDEVFTLTGTSLSSIFSGLPDGDIEDAASHLEVALSVNDQGFIIDTDGVHEITDTDFPDVVDVAYINGYFLWVRKDTGQFIWSTILDGDVYDGLDFATAEESPDNLLAVIVDHSEVLLFGVDTIETWVPSGDPDAPFVKRLGATRERGALSRKSIAQLDNTVFFVGDDRIVYRIGEGLERISSFAIEEALSAVPYADRGDVSGRAYAQDGHTFYVLDIPGNGTYAFDLATGLWHQRKSRDLTLWGGDMIARVDGNWLAGSRTDGALFKIDPEGIEERFGPIEREATAGVPVRSGRPILNSVALDIQTGDGPLTGQGSDPQAMLDWSDDLGRTWSNVLNRSIGKTGQYGQEVVWRRLGRMKSPGRILRFRVTDPVQVVIHGARIDEYIP